MLQDIQETLLALTPQEKMEYMLELGSNLTDDISLFTQEDKVQGCMSTVYIKAVQQDNTLHWYGYADALIVKGYVYIILQTCKDKSPSWIVEHVAQHIHAFVEATNIQQSLTPNRANALANIVQKVIEIAKTY
ncbi:MAG: SufE family protein [Candidatus Woesearchaeota archaeon]